MGWHETILGMHRVSLDWWATLLAGLIVVLAVVDVLPRIPW